MANEAAWLTGVGEQPKVGPADIHEPGEGEMLIQVRYLNIVLQNSQLGIY